MKIAPQSLTMDKLQDTISKFSSQAPMIVVHPTDIPKLTAMFPDAVFTRLLREDTFVPPGKVYCLNKGDIRVFDLK